MLKGWRHAWRAALSGKMPLLAAGIFVLYLYGFYWHLGSFLPGADSDESSSLMVSVSFGNIWRSLLNAPYSILQFLMLKLHLSHLAAGRATSAILVAGLALCLYFLIKNWFGKPTAIFGTLFFISNPWVLILGRTASPQIMMFWLIVIAAAFTWAIKTERHLVMAWLAICISVAIGLYVPGLVWPVLAAGVFLRSEIKKIATALSKSHFYMGLGLAILLVIPLLYDLVAGNVLPRDFLWFPADWPNLIHIGKFWLLSVLAIFIKSPKHTNYILGRSPMLGIAEIALLAFGVFALIKRLITVIYLVLVIAAPVLLMAAINQDATPLYFLLPITSVLCAVGVRFLYIEWQRIFPLNPLPRALALILICLLITVHIVLGLRYSLVAWPHNPEIKQAYMIK